MAYIKCNYSDGMFSSEYFITFGVDYSSPFGGMFVNKEDVVPYKEEKWTGLVRATLQAFWNDKVLVNINDAGEHRLSRLWVPKEDVLIKLDELQVATELVMNETIKHR